jgi:hypothetical protein
MAEIVIRRTTTGTTATFGEIYIDGVKVGVTLEPLHSRRIPTGTYPAQLYDSPRFGRQVVLLDVPGRSFIEIHAGNTVNDTTGCILVGANRTGNSIGPSIPVLENIISLLIDSTTIQVEVQ